MAVSFLAILVGVVVLGVLVFFISGSLTDKSGNRKDD
jgi:hypothetical protein